MTEYIKPKHDNPEDYGLTKEEAYKMRLRYLRQQKKEVETEKNRLYALILRTSPQERWCPQMFWEEQLKQFNKLEANIRHITLLIEGKAQRKDYDIERLKEIPIGNVFDTTAAGFFITNPLRNERTPSNSLHWDKNKNTWTDFGSGEYGDVIDMVQKVNKCSFIKACEILSTYL